MNTEVASIVSPEIALQLAIPVRAPYATTTSRLVALACRAIRQCVAAASDERGLVTQTLTAIARATTEPLLSDQASLDDVALSLGSQGSWEAKLLSRLQQIGDLYKNADARWQGAPSRLVFLGRNSDVALLLGGQPTTAIRMLADVDVQEWGALRLVRRRDLDSSLRSNERLWQSYRDWLNLPNTTIEQWATHLLQEEIAKFSIGEPPDASNIEIFSALRGRFGWRPLEEARDISYPALCRSDLRQGVHTTKLYWLANIDKGSMRIRASSTLRRNDATRLAIAIEKHDTGAMPLPYRLEDERVIVRLTKALPFPEARVTAFALKCGRYEYSWPQTLLPLLVEVFASLGTSLVPSPIDKEK